MSKVHFELEKTIYLMDQLAEMPASQIAMAGRSNVGKSSLINRLAGRKKLAKISSSPGKTRSLNFYMVTPGDFYLVDLPGYGYARTSKKERAQWANLIEIYIKDNDWLRAVAVLLDSRHSPQKIDLELVTFLQGIGMTIIPIMTKADKPKQRDREKVRKQWATILDGQKPLVTSAETGMGMDTAWEALRAAVAK
ncbi:ribosome biogenesis GTP-binding protein YihA/YsxC [Desulfovibrio ferrophilus]|uniref:Probable GTP-binding protein EngB n=1 Tax=Desulfovibrio ferrophilus TaxID=241368 RepID=A0A2Z6AWX8_9BACT|nr:ribosome biogenesis GTP-binding protein YihA/YsxC [Desulfovibrio ferrophilus]BBD07703.1 ribosome biogenesis GTP-binding protein YsxC [Desulfovibrio ferrophilus]